MLKKLYEEENDTKGMRWLFIGGNQNEKRPLVELVLEEKGDFENIWCPNIQIHLDTLLDEANLDKLVKKYFVLNHSQVWELRNPK